MDVLIDRSISDCGFPITRDGNGPVLSVSRLGGNIEAVECSGLVQEFAIGLFDGVAIVGRCDHILIVSGRHGDDTIIVSGLIHIYITEILGDRRADIGLAAIQSDEDV